MKTLDLIKILNEISPNANVYIDAINSPDANEVIVEDWGNGTVDVYICDSAQAHIDYCDTANAFGLESLVIYKANGSKEVIL